MDGVMHAASRESTLATRARLNEVVQSLRAAPAAAAATTTAAAPVGPVAAAPIGPPPAVNPDGSPLTPAQKAAATRARKAAERKAAATTTPAVKATAATAGADLADADLSEIDRLGDDLASVAGLLVREPTLRRNLADPATPDSARAGLLSGLLSGRIGQAAIDVATTAVTGRWSRAADLLDALELVAVDAMLARAEIDGTVADVEDQLFRFSRIVDGDPELAAILNDLSVPVRRRADLVTGLLEGKAAPSAVRLARLAVTGFGGRRFDASLDRLVQIAADRRDRTVAYVTVASALTPEQEERLATRLLTLHGRNVSLRVTVDPAVIGGARVRVGDDLYDGTVARRLDRARTALTRR